MNPLRRLVDGLETRINPGQIDLLELFSVADALRQRGFSYVRESELDETLITPAIDSIFDLSTWESVDASRKLLEMLSLKDERRKIRSKIFGESDVLIEINGKQVNLEGSDDMRKRYTRTMELLTAYYCVKSLRAFSASFGVNIEGAPSGGDFDCVANFQGALYHFEVKSGNVRNLNVKGVENFIERHKFLSPQASILLVDFTLSDKTVLKYSGLRDISKIWRIEIDNKTVYSVSSSVLSNVLIIGIAEKGGWLANMQAALRFLNAYTSRIQNVSYNVVGPKHLGFQKCKLIYPT